MPEILIIDDNPDFVDSIAEILQIENYRTDVALNGREALKKIWLTAYDLLLLDINMPEMGGKEFVKLLNREQYAVPIIIISGMDHNDIKNYFFEQGAISFLKKPFKQETLLSLVNNTIKFTQKFKIRSTQSSAGDLIKKFLPYFDELKPQEREFVDQLLRKINDEMLNNQFSVKFISDEMGLSSRQFNRKVKKYFNRTPHEVLSELRFNMIHNLITNNTLTLDQASEKLGFSSTSYFKKIYKKHVKSA
ncbi:MAG TPA: response regulator [Balneolaceae bacterium]|nr:response regulator [Balneolaceae bacterium]HMB98360.1 response regulator [Balneolaceae bacterium]